MAPKKKKTFKEFITNISELRHFMDENFNYDPEIIKDDSRFSSNKTFCLGLDLSDSKRIKITFSTKSLLYSIVKQSKSDFSNLSTDATYKVSNQNIPIILSSCIDRNHHGHIVAATISPSEDEEVFKFHFRKIKHWLKYLFSYEWNPKFHISDGALAIRNAVAETFERCINCMCFFHMKTKIQNRLKRKNTFVSNLVDSDLILNFRIKTNKNFKIQKIIKEHIMIIKYLQTISDEISKNN